MTKLITEKEEFKKDYKNEVEKTPKEFGEKTLRQLAGSWQY